MYSDYSSEFNVEKKNWVNVSDYFSQILQK